MILARCGSVSASPLRFVQSCRWNINAARPILDQGALGSCTGNAAAGALGTDPLYNTLPAGHPPLDEDFAVRVYSAATKIDPWPGDYPPDDTGSDGLSAAKACKALGLIPGYLHATSLDGMQAALQDTPGHRRRPLV
jgi:hypothetical protein